MVSPRCTFLILGLLLLAGTFFAQGTTQKTQAFRSVDIEIPATVDESFRDFAPRSIEMNSGTMTRYIQLNGPLSQSAREQLQQEGIVLHNAIGENILLASIPADIKASTFKKYGIISFFTLAPEAKRIRVLAPSEKLLLKYIDTYDADLVAELLAGNGIELLEHIPDFPAVYIQASEAQVIKLLKLSWVEFVEEQPEKNSYENGLGHLSVRSNLLAATQIEGVTGNGVHIALGDDGWVGEHIDLQNRVIHFPDVNTDFQGQHGDLVAGLIAGAGNIDPRLVSPAPEAMIHVLNDFDAVKHAGSLMDNQNVVVTCTALSDGCNRGYSSLASLADQQILERPTLMHIFSGGNAGQDDCFFGAGTGWGTITGGVKMAKNALTVANIDIHGERVITSSRGPTTDGRLKPDLSALGQEVVSTLPENNYGTISGSSASAPLVTGVWAQLVEAYRNLFDEDPPSALLKAALLNTADDLGKPGPDYSYGWGKVNSINAWKLIQENRYWLDTLIQGETDTLSLTVPDNATQVKVMLYWHDREGNPLSAKALVNNLDLTMTNSEDVLMYPWVLIPEPDSMLLNQQATPGKDSLNNVEQIAIHSPEAGVYDILIHGQNIPFGPQPYVVVFEFETEQLALTHPLGGERLVPGDSIMVLWDASASESPVFIDFSADGTEEWVTIGVDTQQAAMFAWKLPDVTSTNAFFRIRRDGIVDHNDEAVTIMDVPENVKINKVCADYLILKWDSLPGASGYVVYQMGAYSMDSLLQVEENYLEIPIEDPYQAYWFAVSALTEAGKEGPRSKAVRNEIGFQNCLLSVDLGIQQVSSPRTSVLSSCFSQPIPLGIQIKNNGLFAEESFDLFYQLDDGSINSSTYSGSIPPGVTVNVQFDSMLTITAPGHHSLKIWIDYPEDEAAYNDTSHFDLEVIEAIEYGLPFYQAFDSFSHCGESNDCFSVCSLSKGWMNDRNQVGDEIDWRVGEGATSTLYTGPDNDQNTQSKGKYLFLESSQGCYQKTAHLLSPCVNLGNAEHPKLSFWYHMYGADMGKLHVDLFDGEQWYPNIIVPVLGDRGKQWQKVEADLTAFAGKIIMLRFRGVTGDGFLSDLAIDNVAIYDAFDAPVGGVIVADFSTCPGQSFSISDNSFNSPTTWEWKIHPSSVEFVDGTEASSANPVLQFQEPGEYQVSLVVSNEYGDFVVVLDEPIEVTTGRSLPVIMDFESDSLFELGWNVVNEDGGITWDAIELYGDDNEPTTTFFMNNHNYLDQGEEDLLISPVIDLTDADKPLLRFDVAYNYYDFEYSDKLLVKISTNCGETFEHTVFDKSGALLATVDNTPISADPPETNYWRTEVIDLSDFKGYSIVVQFVNVNGFGNNLYLDNIIVHEQENYPTATFNWVPERDTVCSPEEVTFFHTSNGAPIDRWQWSFGAGASPEESNVAGPQRVSFSSPGTYAVSLNTSNQIGADHYARDLIIGGQPTAQFTYELERGRCSFINFSRWATSYYWDFGDGHYSRLKNPIHQYEESGRYTVTLHTSSDCGEHIKEVPVSVILEGTPGKELDFSILPNPTSGMVSLRIHTLSYNQTFTLHLFDANGRLLKNYPLQAQQFNLPVNISMHAFPEGIYYFKLQSEESVMVKKVIKINRGK